MKKEILTRISNGDFYLISDNHFGHQKVYNTFEPIRQEYANTFEESERKMILDWNSKVNDTDIIIHVGDFCINKRAPGKTEQNIIEFTKKLNGIKILIKGNHDKLESSFYLENGWDYVIDKPLMIKNNLDIESLKNNYAYTGSIHVSINDKEYLISHFPMNYYEGDKYEEQKEYLRGLFMKDGVFNIHGHTHGNSVSEGMLFNVSVENISFKPIKFKDIESWFKEVKL